MKPWPTKNRTYGVALLFLLLFSALPVTAAPLHEDPSEARVRAIAKALRCAVCQNQSIYESHSDLAKDMLEVIRDKVKAGESDALIRDYFFQRYGDYIYLEPTKKGMNLFLWAAPWGGLLVGGLGLLAAFRRWKQKNSDENAELKKTHLSDSPALRDRIEKALKEVEI